jgi:type II secretory ATPase GspE/PulE/Tfp pilus assembly ATPase PilB-like protein
MATLTNDMDVCRRLCDSNVEAYKLDAAAAVSRAQRLSERVAELEGLSGENQAKASRCDKAEAENEQLRAEVC